jgi:flagellar biosynthesis/type III secretory pathway protein FliH
MMVTNEILRIKSTAVSGHVAQHCSGEESTERRFRKQFMHRAEKGTNKSINLRNQHLYQEGLAEFHERGPQHAKVEGCWAMVQRAQFLLQQLDYSLFYTRPFVNVFPERGC